MATVKIWNGEATWNPDALPFKYYNDDKEFQKDAVKACHFMASRLGWPMMDVELQSGSFFTAFEEAVTEYGNQVYEYKVRENYLALEGGDATMPANEMVMEPSLQRIVEISKNYGTEAEVGGNVTLHSAVLEVEANKQKYDLAKWAEEQGIEGGIEIRKIFYEGPPAILRYFDPYAGTGTGVQSLMDAFDFGSFSPGVNFLLMPVSADLLKIQAIEFNDQVRKSAFSFKIVNNQLELFPIPVIPGRLRIEYYKVSDKRALNTSTVVSSTEATHRMNFTVTVPEGETVVKHVFEHGLKTEDISVQMYVYSDSGTLVQKVPKNLSILDKSSFSVDFTESCTGFVDIHYTKVTTNPESSKVITNISEVPYENPTYSKINSIGRQWIFRYALAIAKEMLAYVRGKYTTLPIPDSEATLNQADLLSDARDEKKALIEQLRDMLDQTSRQNQLDRKAQETENLQKILKGVPMCIYIG